MSGKLTWRYRRAVSIAQRVRSSIALRGWRSTLLRISQEFVRRPVIDVTLPLLPLDEPFAPFGLPVSDTPRVSVVIPIHGKLAYTLTCLRSMASSPPTVPFEVIVVDDASPDESASILTQVQGVRLIRHAENVGFVGSCNAGATSARGEFIVFLNNDTQVTPGWIESLLQCFESRPLCGIAGSQLVYPDGRLQEAGAWVFSDASAWNIGRFESRDEPAYCFARQVDYVSGASLAIRRDTFVGLGGFDTRFAPGYYEDTDLAFAARRQGLEVWYVPSSVVIHAEGISSAGIAESGMKRFQAINREKFAEKWAEELTHQPSPGTPLKTVDAMRRRGTIFVSDISSPDASRDSGSLRLIALMQLLVEDGWHVAFAPDDGRADENTIRKLGQWGIEVLARPWVDSIPAWLSSHGHSLHAAILCRHTVAGQYAPFVRRHAPQAHLIFDTVDLHFLREERAAIRAGSAPLSRQASTTRDQELALITAADTTFVVSDYERDMLAKLVPEARVDLLTNIHDVHGRAHGHDGRRDLLFIGGFGHPPNADAMRWMAAEILPALREECPDIRILVAGDVPEAESRALTTAGLTMLGRVPDLAPLMGQALASIAPLRFGAGVKGKVNMSMSHGLPVIGTPIAVEGMKLTDGLDVIVAETPGEFAGAYRRLRDEADVWTRLSDRSIDHVAEHFSVHSAREALRRAIL